MENKRYGEMPCLDGELRSSEEWGHHIFEYTTMVEPSTHINSVALEAKMRLRPGIGLWITMELMSVEHRLQVMTTDFHVIGYLGKEISDDFKQADLFAHHIDAFVVTVIDNDDKDRMVQIRFIGRPIRPCQYCMQLAQKRDGNVFYDPKILEFGGQYRGDDGRPAGGHAPYVK